MLNKQKISVFDSKTAKKNSAFQFQSIKFFKNLLNPFRRIKIHFLRAQKTNSRQYRQISACMNIGWQLRKTFICKARESSNLVELAPIPSYV